MLDELEHLAERIDQLATLTRELRGDNKSLRLALTDAQAEIRSLRSRLDAARVRIEALIDKLPVNE
jgi:cell division protein ZapB